MSQYVLSVTPPTSDCQSSPDCEVMDDSSSVYNRSGTETQYSLTVATQEYDITVRAEACAGSLTAESSVYTVNLTGENLVYFHLYGYNSNCTQQNCCLHC